MDTAAEGCFAPFEALRTIDGGGFGSFNGRMGPLALADIT